MRGCLGEITVWEEKWGDEGPDVQRGGDPLSHSVQMRTQTVVHPTSISSDLSDAALVQPVKSMAEYMLARAKMRWKKV